MEWGGRTTYTRRSGLKGLKQSASPPARRLKDQSVNREKKNYPETQLQPIAYQLDVHACGMQACQMQDAEDHALSSPAHTKLMARFMFERTTGANQAVHCNQEFIAYDRIVNHVGLTKGAEVAQRIFHGLPLRRKPSAKMTPEALRKSGCYLATVQSSTWRTYRGGCPPARPMQRASLSLLAARPSGSPVTGASAVERNSRLAPFFQAHAHGNVAPWRHHGRIRCATAVCSWAPRQVPSTR